MVIISSGMRRKEFVASFLLKFFWYFCLALYEVYPQCTERESFHSFLLAPPVSECYHPKRKKRRECEEERERKGPWNTG